jgi:ribose transport system substrate-binding protein
MVTLSGRSRANLAMAGVALLLAGCGSVSASSSPSTGSAGAPATGGVAQAKRLVAQAERPINVVPPGGAFSTAQARGKSIWFVSVNLTIPFEQYIFKGLSAAARAVGAKAIPFNANGSAAEETRGIEEAVQAHANVIFAEAFSPDVAAPALAQAKAAHIPVVTSDFQDPGRMLPGYPPAVTAVASHSFSVPGKLLADTLVADSNGAANAIFLTTPDVGLANTLEVRAFSSEYRRLCPKCKVRFVAVPTAQWSSLTTKTSELITANPGVNYLVPGFDGMVTFMIPGVTSAGALNRVHIISFNATPSVMEALKHHDGVVADIGGPNLLQGWAFGDQAIRLLSGDKPLLDLGIEDRLFDATNINTINLRAEESTWYTRSDYAGIYRRLWGVR